ncbi:uncharacterized protein [Aegilops tauschii subsp. strangulata]|uniref:Transcription repressor n=1 Tax=Aegilops tauschii subsp. strangulata TaxID=200361 RepID=A0A453HNG7_AEGTS|nr:transcription repressor OFP8 [Aegilops tauschii subsp. strangulata]
MSSTGARRGGGSGGGHFPVGRRRHVAVVDTGCSCRPRRPRMLLSLPSFLKPSSASKTPAAPARSTSSSSLFPSSSSTASFSTSYASSNCSNYYSSYHGFGAAPKLHQQQEHLPSAKEAPAATPASPVRRQPASMKKKQKKRYYVENKTAMAEAGPEEDVGLAVEKDSSDPRADFRESMVQMVVETGLCSWDDLRSMLRRLLALNSPRHHAAILTAFAELCAQLASPPPPATSSYHYQL